MMTIHHYKWFSNLSIAYTVILSAILIIHTSEKYILKRSITIPQGFQRIICNSILDILPEKKHESVYCHLPVLSSFIILVVVNNIYGLIPEVFTPTTNIYVNLTFNIIIFTYGLIIGIYRKGLRYFTYFTPSGIPLAISIFIFVIKFSSFLLKPFISSLRMTIQVIISHIIIHILLDLTKQIGAGLHILVLGIVFLELLMMSVQIYVYTLNTVGIFEQSL